MSKKTGNKAKAKVPEIDPESPEWLEEVARKKSEAYDMVQRAMIRSQIHVMLTTRDDMVRQKAEIEAKIAQQSQDQNDIYQYLRKRLKDNYLAIAELEAKVSEAHEDRLKHEKGLIATTNDLEAKRKNEKINLLESVQTLDVELEEIKEFQENSVAYEQKLEDLGEKITACKEAFRKEVALLNSQIEEEWETGRKDKEERIKITKKAAAKATQEQLGPRTKHMIAQNKKMMAELRFQCFEVEKMERARHGLLKSNSVLLAKAASARHGVEELARRSHLLQRIIRYMHSKLQARRAHRGDCRTDSGARRSSEGGDLLAGESGFRADQDSATGVGQRYKLAGMTEEERQQLLDLREELRVEEVGIAAAQAVVEEKRAISAERSRVLTLKADLARVLVWCHEDPLLGVRSGRRKGYMIDGSNNTGGNVKQTCPTSAHHQAAVGTTKNHKRNPAGREDIGPEWGDQDEKEEERHSQVSVVLPSIERTEQHGPAQPLHPQGQRTRTGAGTAAAAVVPGASACDEATNDCHGSASDHDNGFRYNGWHPGDDGGLSVWPENVLLFPGEQNPGEIHTVGSARCLDIEVLKAVSRLFLAKLQVSAEPTSPRPFEQRGLTSLPVLAGLSPIVGINGTMPRKGRRRTRRNAERVGCGGFSTVQRRDGSLRDSGSDGGAWTQWDRGGRREDSCSIWSDRQTTGIPSWDILETAVRHTKRQRTRDVACQTLTYRELRDHSATNSTPSSGAKNSAWQATSQIQAPTQAQTHAPKQTSPVPKRVLKAAAPGSPNSLATSVSGSSVFRVTRGGGTVHGAVVRGSGGVGCTGKDKRTPVLRYGRAPVARIVGGGGDGNMQANAGVEQQVGAVVAKGMGLIQGGIYEEASRHYHNYPAQHPPQVTPPLSPLRRPEAIGTRDHRTSPPVSHVGVSWGEEEGKSSTAGRSTDVGGEEASERGYVRAHHEHRNSKGQEGATQASVGRESEMDGGLAGVEGVWTAPGNRGCGDAYAPLPRGPDYRKVLLYTVNDDDCRLTRRAAVPGGGTVANIATAGTAATDVSLAHGQDNLGNIFASANTPMVEKDAVSAVGTTMACATATATATAGFKKPSTAAAGTIRSRRRRARPTDRPGSKGLLRGKSRGSTGGSRENRVRGVAGSRQGTARKEEALACGWDADVEAGGFDPGPLRSVSTLSAGELMPL